MVGNVGALKTANMPPQVVIQATEYAMALITGWAKGDKAKFTADLQSMQDAAKHNAEVYKQASDVLNDLSRREREARDLMAQASAAQADAAALARSTAADIAKQRRELSDDRTKHHAEVAQFKAYEEGRVSELRQREMAVLTREVAAKAEGEQLQARATDLRTLAERTEKLKADLESKAARTRAIWES